MAGKIIVDTLQTESTFLQMNVGTTRIATMNASGIYSNTGTKMIGSDGTIGVATVDGSALVDNTVTAAKIVSVANTQITGVITTSQLANNLTVNASSIISSANIDFKVGASQNTAFRIENTGQLYNSVESTSGTDYRGSLYAGYMCRAWVNFNGTNTVAIRASGNVSSITDNGTGDYTVNFTTAMPDANYAATCFSVEASAGPSSDRMGNIARGSGNYLAGSVRVVTNNIPSPNTLFDQEIVVVSVFR
jgi:hypothetical protein